MRKKKTPESIFIDYIISGSFSNDEISCPDKSWLIIKDQDNI